MPLVSVIIPIYKVEPYLRRCIDSVISQTYTNLEIILVDDGSPDNCPAICDEYAQKDNRIKVIHKRNGGLSSARNAGLDICKGDYISFIDSDDWVSPSYIQTLLKNALEKNADISIVSYTTFTEGFSDYYTIPQFSTIETFNNHDLLRHLCLHDYKEFMASWGKLFKKNCFNNIRFPVGQLYEDSRINYKIYHKTTKACFQKTPLYFYLARKDSIMGKTTSSLHALDSMIERYIFLKQNNEYEAACCCTQDLCWDLLFAYCEFNNKRKLPYKFKDSNEILLLLKETLKDFNHLSKKKFSYFVFLNFFCHFPKFYTLYRKIAPFHIRKY